MPATNSTTTMRATSARMVVATMPLPRHAVGCITGPRGSFLQQLRTELGAAVACLHVNVPKKKKELAPASEKGKDDKKVASSTTTKTTTTATSTPTTSTATSSADTPSPTLTVQGTSAAVTAVQAYIKHKAALSATMAVWKLPVCPEVAFALEHGKCTLCNDTLSNLVEELGEEVDFVRVMTGDGGEEVVARGTRHALAAIARLVREGCAHGAGRAGKATAVAACKRDAPLPSSRSGAASHALTPTTKPSSPAGATHAAAATHTVATSTTTPTAIAASTAAAAALPTWPAGLLTETIHFPEQLTGLVAGSKGWKMEELRAHWGVYHCKLVRVHTADGCIQGGLVVVGTEDGVAAAQRLVDSAVATEEARVKREAEAAKRAAARAERASARQPATSASAAAATTSKSTASASGKTHPPAATVKVPTTLPQAATAAVVVCATGTVATSASCEKAPAKQVTFTTTTASITRASAASARAAATSTLTSPGVGDRRVGAVAA